MKLSFSPQVGPLSQASAKQATEMPQAGAEETRVASRQHISIRSWRDEDEPALLELQRAVSGEGDLTSPEFFDWQYRQNPAGKAFIGIAQEPGGMIVAQYAAVPLPLRVNGERTTVTFAINAATHPDYRRLSLFTRCAKKVFEDQIKSHITHTFAFPTLYAYLGQMKIGFRDLGLTHLLMKLHNPEAFLADMGFSKQWSSLGIAGGWLLKTLQRKPRRIQPVQEVNSFDGIPVEKLAEPVNIIVDADARWLNWRYVTNPKRRYRIAVARNSGEIAGFVVHRIENSGSRTWGIIMDLMLSPKAGIETVESLMNHVFSANIDSDCSLTICLTSPGSRKEELLRRCGFWTVPKRIRSKGISTGLLLCRDNNSYTGDIRMEDIDLAFGMHDVL
ncbi:MAG: GNAT family N-acetyltransferase [Desulfomonile tiedjei]|uniref:GNAT family N-acetyltransferase n=1 Tax=Desulfomonile tiedjei TaxID=2358 RepID=A0A9D6V628_9BACT|nr:GNAT family N-acetyltransferase [Desulfomonile tiedjei]